MGAPRAAARVAPRVSLREVRDEDLPVFHEQQLDEEATRMADFPSREREAFFAHWARIRAEPANVLRTVVHDGRVAGNVVSWLDPRGRVVGYWLGREHWGRGVASAALPLFLAEVRERPLHAQVAPHNVASLRVLEKTGFAREPAPRGDGLVHLRLD